MATRSTSLTRRGAAVIFVLGSLAAAWGVACSRPGEPERTSSTSGAVLAYPSGEGPVDYSGSVTGAYPGAFVLTGPTKVYLIFYGSWASAEKQLVRDFIDGLSGSPLASVVSTYTAGWSTAIPNTFTRSTAEYADTTYSQGQDLTQSQIQAVIEEGVTKHVYPADGEALYLVLPDATVNAVSPFPPSQFVGFCAKPGGLCGYHPTTPLFSNAYLHGVFAIHPGYCAANPGPQGAGCQTPILPGPNGAKGHMDAMLNVVWHEIAEQLTDPNGNGFHVHTLSADGGPDGIEENADQCESYWFDSVTLPMVGAVQYDFLYTTNDAGARANTHLGSGTHAHDFQLQPLWQNADRGGCVRRVSLNRPAARPTALAGIGAATGDLDGNGVTDFLWRNTATSALSGMELDTSDQIASSGPVSGGGLWPTAQIYGLADFDHDGRADILLRDVAVGDLAYWTLNGLSVVSRQIIAYGLTTSELLKAVGDFDGDGRTDILFQSTKDNSARVWFNVAGQSLPLTLDSNTLDFTNVPVLQPASVPSNAETVGTGDFDGDGTSEVLWHDLSASTYSTWKYTDPGHTGTPTLVTSTALSLPGVSYVIGIVDVDRDGTADLIGVNSSGDPILLVWVRMVGGVPAGPAQTIHDYPANQWRFAGGGRFGGGEGGVLWYDRTTGDVARWELSSSGAFTWSSHVVVGQPMNEQLVSN